MARKAQEPQFGFFDAGGRLAPRTNPEILALVRPDLPAGNINNLIYQYYGHHADEHPHYCEHGHHRWSCKGKNCPPASGKRNKVNGYFKDCPEHENVVPQLLVARDSRKPVKGRKAKR